MSVSIMPERPDTTDALALIRELEACLDPLYPAESRHGFSVDRLVTEEVAFFVLRDEGTAAGCGGVKLFDTAYGEVKRMYVRPMFRSRGFGKLILDHLASYSREQGASLLRLETGVYQTEALGLYERLGFQRIPPFGSYRADPLSVFYQKRLI